MNPGRIHDVSPTRLDRDRGYHSPPAVPRVSIPRRETWPGWLVAAAISVIDSDEVLPVKIGCAGPLRP